MTDPYDITTEDDKAKGLRRYVDRMGNERITPTTPDPQDQSIYLQQWQDQIQALIEDIRNNSPAYLSSERSRAVAQLLEAFHLLEHERTLHLE
jgi:hypothetical protein